LNFFAVQMLLDNKLLIELIYNIFVKYSYQRRRIFCKAETVPVVVLIAFEDTPPQRGGETSV